MKGLLLKDFLVLTKQMKMFLILIPIMAITGGVPMASIAILLGAMLPMTALAYDEQSKWNDLAMMMPYSKKNIVLSKYVLGYLCMTGASILFMVAQVVMTTTQHKDLRTNLYMILFAILCGLLFIAINTPISFKYGVQKGRIVFIVCVGISATASSIFKDVISEIPTNMISTLPVMAILAVLLLNVVSVVISLCVKQP